MAPGSSKHPRDEESGPSRPHKASRVGEGTREQAIVLDDSDDNGSDLTLVEETSHPLKTEEVRLADPFTRRYSGSIHSVPFDSDSISN